MEVRSGRISGSAADVDLIDRKILAALQADASLSVQRVAEQVGLSHTPCWRRIQRLEQTGIIKARVALVDPRALGLGLSVFVSVTTDDHSAEWRAGFAAAVEAMPEAMELYRMAGDVDYLLRVVVPDMEAYDDFYKRLTDRVAIKSITSRFAMEAMKSTTAFPLDTTSRQEPEPARAGRRGQW
jgi:Lrp/AsnC family transcriptional regulator